MIIGDNSSTEHKPDTDQVQVLGLRKYFVDLVFLSVPRARTSIRVGVWIRGPHEDVLSQTTAQADASKHVPNVGVFMQDNAGCYGPLAVAQFATTINK